MIGKTARPENMMAGTGAVVEVGRGIEEEIEIMSIVETENMGGTGTGIDTEDRSKGSQLLPPVVLALPLMRIMPCDKKFGFYCHLI